MKGLTIFTISKGVFPVFSLIKSAGLFSYTLKVSKYRPASSELHERIKLKSKETETRINSLKDLP